MVEIERKFLLLNYPQSFNDAPCTDIKQGYIQLADGSSIRLRERNNRHILTVKSGRGLIRSEQESIIDETVFQLLWQKVSVWLAKTRTVYTLDCGLVAEVDHFKGPLEGLVLVEVEFGSVAEAESFSPPEWFGDEVTNNKSYGNRSLAKRYTGLLAKS